MVLGAFSEALIAGKRVAVVGNSSTGLAESLAPSAGRRLYVFDPDPQRTAENVARSPQQGSSRVSYVVLDEDLDAHAGAFDVVVVADLAEFAEPLAVVRQARELLGRRGVAVVAAPNRRASGRDGDRRRSTEGLDYYELYDALAAEFAKVRTLGQAPFVGYTLADFAAEAEPAVTIDSSLCADPEEPQWFVMVAGDGPFEFDPYTLVQVPAATGVRWLGDGAPDVDRAADTAALAEARLQIEVLSAELDGLREQRRRETRLAEQRRADATSASSRAAELEGALREQREQLTRARARMAEIEAALARSRERCAELEEAAAAGQSDRQKLEGRLARQRHRVTELEDALATIAEREAELEHELAELRAREAESGNQAELPGPSPREEQDAAAARRLEFQLAELKKTLAATRNERAALQVRADAAERLERDLAAAESARKQSEQRLNQALAGGLDEAAAEAHARDVAMLEAALEERGRFVAELEHRLRESARAGTELLRRAARLEAAAASRDASSGPLVANADSAGAGVLADRSDDAQSEADAAEPDGGVEESAAIEANLRAELELLAQQGAASRADLEAARWTIAGLRHQLAADAETTPELRKLEEALRDARAEIAELRGRLRQRRGTSD